MNPLHVIFGTGPAGRAIMEVLLLQGFRVRMVNRSGRGQFPTGVELLNGDVSNAAFVKQAISGAYVAYQTLNAPYHRWAEAFPPLQAGLLAGMKGSGIRLVVLENLYLYGNTQGVPMRENSPVHPVAKKGLVRAQMAADLLHAHHRGEVEVVIARASDFVGPGVRQSTLGERAFAALLNGKAISVMGNPDLPHAYTYLPDLGRAMVHLGTESTAAGKVWHLPCAPILTNRETLQLFADAQQQPLKLSVMPRWLMKVLGWFIPEVGELPEMLYQWEHPFIVDDSAIREAYGIQATPWPEIVRATLAWWQEAEKEVR